MSCIDQFYTTLDQEDGQLNNVTAAASFGSKPTIDRSFQEQIWSLLTKHPNVSVGKERTFNHLPLSDIEATHSNARGLVTVSAQRKSGSTDPADGRANADLPRADPASIEGEVSGTTIASQVRDDALHTSIAEFPERDESGFPRTQQPTLQNRDGQANLANAPNAANLSGFNPPAGDLVALEKGSEEYSVEMLGPDDPLENDDYCYACGGLGELICCDGCSNAFHGACLEPPIDTADLSDDRWYCPRCETSGVRNATSQGSPGGDSTTSATKISTTRPAAVAPRSTPTRRVPKTKRRTPAKRVLKTKPKGRPRKFLPGTENFWRLQILTAPSSFTNRPPNFDATLLQAIKNGLPIPADSADITQDWIDRTSAVLSRSATGLYISPRGTIQRAYGKHKTASQVMIIKSARLQQVDLSESHTVFAVRFLTSSAAHTFAHVRYYPLSKTSNKPAISRVAKSATRISRTTPQTPERRKGPKLGIFYDEKYEPRCSRNSPFTPGVVTLHRLPGQSVSTVGSPIGLVETGSQSRTTSPQPLSESSSDTTPSENHPRSEEVDETFSSRRPNGLPPPLTTRAASKRKASMQDGHGRDSPATSQSMATNSSPRTNLGGRQKSRPDREPQFSDYDDSHERPKKRVRRSNTVLSRTTARQQIILDMIARCGGAIPDNSLVLRKSFTAALHRSGEAGESDKRTVEGIVKALCTVGKLKKSTFSFRDQRGFMVVSSILAKPEVGPADLSMLQLQKKIIESYPNHHVPPGMYANQPSQAEDSYGPLRAAQPQHPQETAEPPPKRTQISSALQPIENDASGSTKNAGRTPGAKGVARRKPLAVTARSLRQSDLDDNLGPRLSSRKVSDDTNEDGTFLMRQQQPIIFDSQVSAESTVKPAEKLTKKVVWRKGPQSRPMPKSLEEILRDGTRRTRSEHRLAEEGPRLMHFESEVDCVARWEERSFNRFQENNHSQSWNFICHSVGKDFEAVRMENVVVYFNGLTWYDEWGQEKLYTPAELKQLWVDLCSNQSSPDGIASSPVISQQLDISGVTLPPDISALDRSLAGGNSQAKSSNQRKRKAAKTKPSKRRARKKRKTEDEPAYITNPDGEAIDVSGYVNAPAKRHRGAQHLRNMPEAAIYKLTVAIVVIKTLSGGLDKHVDWALVLQIFPDENVDFIRDRWRTIKNKFRRDIAALTENLQDQFCSAYMEGEVPDLDFDDIYNNDWEGIVEWAVRNLDKSCVKGVEDLPDTREELVQTKKMTFEEQRGMRDHMWHNINPSIPVRESAQASTVFPTPLQPFETQPPPFDSDALGEEDDRMDVAKSWALATVLTPEGVFNAQGCKKKLSKLAKSSRASDAIFDRALKLMVAEKTVVRDRDGNTGLASRSYRASKLFHDAFGARRTVQATLLQQAACYKREILDPAFRVGQQVIFQPTSVADGDMVAILNLLANGRMRVQIGPDVPKNRYGLLNEDGTGTYQTRRIDRERLNFTVLVEAVEGKYVYGNPTEMQVAPVPAIGNYEKTAIPVWVDIHGNFQDELWELVICAVIGLISTRPGIDAEELTKTLSPSVKLWEIEVVLQWMERCGLVEVSGGGMGHGWDTTEWWWMICGALNGWHVGNLS